MAFSKIKLLTISLLFPLGVLGWQVSSLYISIQPAFKKLEEKIPVAREIHISEAYIGTLLFDEENRKQMKPSGFLAREGLRTERDSSLIKDQFKQTLLAKRLESKFNQDDLLIHWLSTVYLGNGEYGLATTAQSLFGKNSRDLSNAEALAIAALIQAPSRNRNNEDLWEKRQSELTKQLIQRTDYR